MQKWLRPSHCPEYARPQWFTDSVIQPAVLWASGMSEMWRKPRTDRVTIVPVVEVTFELAFTA